MPQNYVWRSRSIAGWFDALRFRDLPWNASTEKGCRRSDAIAVRNEEVAVLVDEPDVTSRKPSADNGFRGNLWRIPIALHHVGAADLNLAGLSIGGAK